MKVRQEFPRHSRCCFASCFLFMILAPSPAIGQSHIQGWGRDNLGQVSDIPSGGSFTQVAAGGKHGLALSSDGSIWTWGGDSVGQVSNTPTGSGFTAVAGGWWHSLAVSADGSIQAWGGDLYGQVSNTPTGTGFTQVAAGRRHSLALRADGSIVAWGSDLSDIGTFGGQVSQTPTGTGFVQVAAGSHFSYALRLDGSIAAWGYDNYSVVSGAPTGTGFVELSGGYVHAMARRVDGSLVSWGSNADQVFQDTPHGGGHLHSSAGMDHSAAILADGSVVSWGGEEWSGVVTDTPPGGGFTRLAGGRYFTLGLRDAVVGNGYCFGDGGGAACPCGANGNLNQGCANSAGNSGASLVGLGHAQVSSDSFQLAVSGAPDNVPGLILRGATQVNGGLGNPIGDGLLCVGGNSARSQVQLAAGGVTTFSDFQGSPFGVSHFGIGVPTNYQFWYRDPQNSCSGSGFNFSNAWTVDWSL